MLYRGVPRGVGKRVFKISNTTQDSLDMNIMGNEGLILITIYHNYITITFPGEWDKGSNMAYTVEWGRGSE